MFAPTELLERIGLPSEHDIREAAEELLRKLELARSLPVRLTPLCRHFGAHVQPAQKGPSCVTVTTGRPLIAIKCESTQAIKENPELRFILAHELGHVLLYRWGIQRPLGGREYWLQERLCDLFAELILCPGETMSVMEPHLSTLPSAMDAAEKITETYQVPVRVACDRISDLASQFRFALFRMFERQCIKATCSSFATRRLRGVKLQPTDQLHGILISIRRGTRVVLSPDQLYFCASRLRLEHLGEAAIRRRGDREWLMGLEVAD